MNRKLLLCLSAVLFSCGVAWTQTADNSAATQIVYVNGRRVAKGKNLEPIVLVDQERSGEKGAGRRQAVAYVACKELQGNFTAHRPESEFLRL